MNETEQKAWDHLIEGVVTQWYTEVDKEHDAFEIYGKRLLLRIYADLPSTKERILAGYKHLVELLEKN